MITQKNLFASSLRGILLFLTWQTISYKGNYFFVSVRSILNRTEPIIFAEVDKKVEIFFHNRIIV